MIKYKSPEVIVHLYIISSKIYKYAVKNRNMKKIKGPAVPVKEWKDVAQRHLLCEQAAVRNIDSATDITKGVMRAHLGSLFISYHILSFFTLLNIQYIACCDLPIDHQVSKLKFPTRS